MSLRDGSVWLLGKMLTAKPWPGHGTKDDPQFEPSEVHGVFEAEQMKGTQPGLAAIIKIRIEFVSCTAVIDYAPISLRFRVPLNHQALEPPEERAKYVAEDQYGVYTVQENDTLDALTKDDCSVTPKLYLLHADVQDESILRSKDGYTYWMLGGYIVYIVMQKIPAIPLNFNMFWNEFSLEQRTEIRTSFREGCL